MGGGGVGIVALVGFDGAWNQLHEVLFTNDLWLLDPRTDRLIQMFPETFWAEATFIVVGMALAEAVVLVGGAGGYLWFTRPPSAEQADPQEEAGHDGEAAEGEEAEEAAEGGEAVEDEEEGDEGLDSGDDGLDDEEPADETEPEEAEESVEDGEEPGDQEEQPQPPPPQAQPPEAPNSGSI